MTTKEGNILIAKFMGVKAVKMPLGYWKLYNSKTDTYFFDGWTKKGVWENLLKNNKMFHSSWDLLIPVVKKIRWMPSKDVHSEFHNEFIIKKELVLDKVLDLDITDVFNSVVDFVEWQNKNN